MPISSQRLPHTEGLVSVALAPMQHTEGIARLRAEDKHPALIESERVLRLLYGVIATYDTQHPKTLTEDVRRAMLTLRDTLSRHNLAEQSIRLEIAVAEICKCQTLATGIRVRRALAEVDRFLRLPLSEA